MIPYGSKRTYAEYTVVRYRGGKVHIKQTVKSRKYGRNKKDYTNELQD